ncbi:hypothetical protein HG536_0B02510 [Torulaspora globosa]|uniref:Phenylalanine--tRNA ligase, mitochondrial n=1 Tax=Torulaspora globosa TaxID=48254 RepID=A0A7G3ZD02_9SACH|nr:uncharacterized protein HG536_0B02510 [Torulaspora globosa]QLL31388.1 hypothetical protein HG536_0B02510 [Torulaspora globosa]
MAMNRALTVRLCGTFRLYSQAARTVEINGQKYVADSSYTNVTPSIIGLTDRALHLKESHPVGILREAIEKKLNSTDSAFTVYNQFKPVVTRFENFDSLGFPADHPGRSKSDTYYVNENYLLRTHTSAHEMECFNKIKSGKSERPGFLISADVYRRDEIDRTHYPVFHQMEGCRVWKREPSNAPGQEPAHITRLRAELANLEEQLLNQATKVVVEDDTCLEDNPKQEYMTDIEVDLCSRHLKRSIELVMTEVFQRKIESMKKAENDTSEIPSELKVRWIKAYFPWTAPSWEIEVWWQGDWLELCGCGLVREEVLQRAGFEPESTISWAFGLGLDRIAMLLFEIPDIRLFWTKDNRFHDQFQKEVISTFKPYSKYPGTLRDVAFWLTKDKQLHTIHENDVMEIVRNVAGDLIESVKLVDQFEHPKTGRTSLCYRINYQSMDRNITNSEINKLQEQVRSQLAETYGVELR